MMQMQNLTAYKGKKRKPPVFFNRQELRQLLEVYSRRVVAGEWKDYAIDHHGGPFCMVAILTFGVYSMRLGQRYSWEGKSAPYRAQIVASSLEISMALP